MTGQLKFGLVKSDRSTIFCIQNLFGPKMHLRMEFDSGIGPTCLDNLPVFLPRFAQIFYQICSDIGADLVKYRCKLGRVTTLFSNDLALNLPNRNEHGKNIELTELDWY